MVRSLLWEKDLARRSRPPSDSDDASRSPRDGGARRGERAPRPPPSDDSFDLTESADDDPFGSESDDDLFDDLSDDGGPGADPDRIPEPTASLRMDSASDAHSFRIPEPTDSLRADSIDPDTFDPDASDEIPDPSDSLRIDSGSRSDVFEIPAPSDSLRAQAARDAAEREARGGLEDSGDEAIRRIVRAARDASPDSDELLVSDDDFVSGSGEDRDAAAPRSSGSDRPVVILPDSGAGDRPIRESADELDIGRGVAASSYDVPAASESMRADPVSGDASELRIPEPTESMRVDTVDPDRSDDGPAPISEAGGPSSRMPIVVLPESEPGAARRRSSADELIVSGESTRRRPNRESLDELDLHLSGDPEVLAAEVKRLRGELGRLEESLAMSDADAPRSDDASDSGRPSQQMIVVLGEQAGSSDELEVQGRAGRANAETEAERPIVSSSDDQMIVVLGDAESGEKRRLSGDELEVEGGRKKRDRDRQKTREKKREKAAAGFAAAGVAGASTGADRDLLAEIARLKKLIAKLERDKAKLAKKLAAMEAEVGVGTSHGEDLERELAAARHAAAAARASAARRLLLALLLPPILAGLTAGGIAWWLAGRHDDALLAASAAADRTFEARLVSARDDGRRAGLEAGRGEGHAAGLEAADAALAGLRADLARATEQAAAARDAARDEAREAAEAAREAERRALADKIAEARAAADRAKRDGEEQRRLLADERARRAADLERARKAFDDERTAADDAAQAELDRQRRELEAAHRAAMDRLSEELAGGGGGDDGFGGAATEEDPFAAFDEGGEEDPFAAFDEEGSFGDDEFEQAFGDEGKDFLSKAYDWYREHLKTTIDYKVFAHFERGAADDTQIRHEVVGRIEFNDYLDFIDEDLRLVAIAKFQDDDNALTAEVARDVLQDDRERRPHASFEEAYIAWRFGDFDVRAGQIIFAWGSADLSNPTDVVNPIDFTDILDSEKIGVPALELAWSPGPIVLEAIVVPWFAPTRQARQAKRFSFIPIDFPITIIGADEPANVAQNVQFGGRITTTVAGIDLAASFFDGYNDIPSTRLLIQGGQLVIEPVFDRVRMAGVDFATTWRSFQFHGEAAYIQTEGDRDDDFLQYVIGAETTLNDVILEHDLRIIIEYIGEAVLLENEQNAGGGLGRAFSSTFAGRLTYELSAFVRFEAVGAIILDGPDNGFLELTFEWDATDNLTLTLGYDLIAGNEDSFFGQFKDEDRVFGKVRFSF